MHISAKNSRRFFGDVSKDAVGSRRNNIDGKNEEGSALLSVNFSYEEEYVYANDEGEQLAGINRLYQESGYNISDAKALEAYWRKKTTSVEL